MVSVFLDEVVLANSLNQEVAAGCASRVRHAVCGWGRYGCRLPDTDFVPPSGTERFDHDRVFQPVIVLSDLGVMVPRNEFAGIERVLAHQDIGASCHDVDMAHCVGL